MISYEYIHAGARQICRVSVRIEYISVGFRRAGHALLLGEGVAKEQLRPPASAFVIPAKAGIQRALGVAGRWMRSLDSRLRALLSGINDGEQQASVVQTGEKGVATLRRLNCVIPREVAESMRRILIDRRMDCSDYASLRAE